MLKLPAFEFLANCGVFFWGTNEAGCPQKNVVAGTAELVGWADVAKDGDISASTTHEPIVIDFRMFIVTSDYMRTVSNQMCQTKSARMFQMNGMNGIKEQTNGMNLQTDGVNYCKGIAGK